MKLVNFLKPIECNQPIILKEINSEIVLFTGICFSLFTNERFRNYQVIKSRAMEDKLFIYVKQKENSIEKENSSIISFHANNEYQVTIEDFSNTIQLLIDELKEKGYDEEDYISIVAVGSSYRDGDDKSNATLIKIDLY